MWAEFSLPDVACAARKQFFGQTVDSSIVVLQIVKELNCTKQSCTFQNAYQVHLNRDGLQTVALTKQQTPAIYIPGTRSEYRI